MAKISLMLTTLLAGLSANAFADAGPNWYVGAGLGSAQTDVSQRTVASNVSDPGVTITNFSLDKRDTAAELFVGYQFNQYIAVELGYLDLGERSLTFQGEVPVNFEQEFLTRVAKVYPVSGDGVTVAVNVSMPLGEAFSVTGRLGFFSWQGDYTSINGQTDNGSDKPSDTDFWYGLRLGYDLSKRWQVFSGYSRYDLSGHDNTMWSVGAAYSF